MLLLMLMVLIGPTASFAYAASFCTVVCFLRALNTRLSLGKRKKKCGDLTRHAAGKLIKSV